MTLCLRNNIVLNIHRYKNLERVIGGLKKKKPGVNSIPKNYHLNKVTGAKYVKLPKDFR